MNSEFSHYSPEPVSLERKRSGRYGLFPVGQRPSGNGMGQLGYDRQYTSKECRKLLSAGLLDQEDNLYFLSDQGREFLEGNVEADEIEEPE